MTNKIITTFRNNKEIQYRFLGLDLGNKDDFDYDRYEDECYGAMSVIVVVRHDKEYTYAIRPELETGVYIVGQGDDFDFVSTTLDDAIEWCLDNATGGTGMTKRPPGATMSEKQGECVPNAQKAVEKAVENEDKTIDDDIFELNKMSDKDMVILLERIYG